MNVELAKSKICPFLSTPFQDGTESKLNVIYCLGGACMAWKWDEVVDGPVNRFSQSNTKPHDSEGRCLRL